LLLSSLSVASEVKINSDYELNAHIRRHQKKTLMKELRSFVSVSKPNRFIGTKGHFKSQIYLEKKLKSLTSDSASMLVQSFKLDSTKSKDYYTKQIKADLVDDKWKRFKKYMYGQVERLKSKKLKNLLWLKQGKTNNLLVIVAHYDTVSHDKETMKIDINAEMPGADYNASGVTIALSIAQILKDIDSENSVLVLLTDAQSIAFAGTTHFLESNYLGKFDVKGIINLEMLGHDSRTMDKEKKLGNMICYARSKNLKDKSIWNYFETSNKKYGPGVKFKYRDNNFQNSDHSIFWEKGFSAVTFSQNWEDDFNSKRFQTPNAFPETLNQSTLYGAYKYLASGTLYFALNRLKFD